MGKDRRKDKAEEDESLGKKKDKFGKKGDGKMAPTQGPDKSFVTRPRLNVRLCDAALRARALVHLVCDDSLTRSAGTFCCRSSRTRCASAK